MDDFLKQGGIDLEVAPVKKEKAGGGSEDENQHAAEE